MKTARPDKPMKLSVAFGARSLSAQSQAAHSGIEL
jgi:hypothetical protein